MNAKDRVEERVRDERALILRELSNKLSDAYITRQIGKKSEVLLESRKNGAFYGTTGNYLKVKIDSVPLNAQRGEILKGHIEKKGVFVVDES